MTGRGFPKPQRFSDCSFLRRVGPQPFPPGTLPSGHRRASLRSRVCRCSLAAGYIEVGVEADPPCDRELGWGYPRVSMPPGSLGRLASDA
jgi:hypothetical protein